MTLPNVPNLTVMAPTNDATYAIAAIIDNIVYQVIRTDGQSAAQFLAQPTFVQVDPAQVQAGYLYDAQTNQFTPPQP